MTDHPAPGRARRIRLRGRPTQADGERDHHAHLPFDVPPGVAAMHVSLDQDPAGDTDAGGLSARRDGPDALAAGHVRIEIRDGEGPATVTDPIFLEAS